MGMITKTNKHEVYMVKKWNGNFINPYIEHGEKRDKVKKVTV